MHRKTFRRGFQGDFDFEQFNLGCIEQRPQQGELVAAIDASYIDKSGKKTEGLGYFYSGCAKKAKKGLEVSEIALIDRDNKQAYGLSSQQTIDVEGKSRVDSYAEHITSCAPKLPSEVRYLLADGYYAKRTILDSLDELDKPLYLVSRLRCDANLDYLYEGAYAGMGAPQQYDGKVYFNDLSRFDYHGEIEDKIHVYTKILRHKHFKRLIRVVVLLNMTKPNKPTYIVLFSTDLNLCAFDIIKLYQLRFQLEFLFRDAKQFTGLTHCQARNSKALTFHWNLSFAAVNLAKLDLLQQHHQSQAHTSFVFSLAAYTQRFFSRTLLKRLLSNLDLDLSSNKVTQAFNKTLAFGFRKL